MKKITTLLFVLLLSFGAYAQFNLSWSNSYSYTVTSGYSNEARKVAVDASGFVFVLSDITSDFDSTNHSGPTQYYVVLRKYTPAGVLVKQKTFDVKNMPLTGTHDYKSAFALEIDGSGNVFIGFNKYNSAGNNYDVQVMKYDNGLNTAWTFIYATSANESGVNFVRRGSAAFLLFKSVSGANTTYSIARVLPNTISSQPMYSFDTNIDVAVNIVTTPTKNLFVTGYRLISGVKNVMTASVTTTGLLKWKTTYNNSSVTGDDSGSDLIASNDGYLYVCGTSYANATNGTDALLLRYNSANGTQNSRLLINIPAGASINETGYEVVDGPAGTVYFSATRGVMDAYVYKVSTTNGLVLSANAFYRPIPSSFTAINSISIGDMKVSSSGKVYICGGLTAGSAIGNFTASYLANFGMSSGVFSFLSEVAPDGNNIENYQGISMAMDPPRNTLVVLRNFWSTNFTHASESFFLESYAMGVLREGTFGSGMVDEQSSFYPNPASEKIYFKNADLFDSISMFDLSGRLIRSFNSKINEADISDIAPGQYLLRYISSSHTKSETIIIQ